ncbi:hypothetical protein LDK30_01605 [Fusobacterium polymorphum]|uniref:Uncharacterized protein n=1 Tax=Fusobacterium nucleatum subsp. polymorphum TaxID=76857 RepID=A0A2C6CAD8_FUSNP|nr:hypothetical protein [Fusobacterium polymorphum]PHI13075.1 hypothetical protein CBG59_04720 [Fusobacterium polymorphum]
MPGGIVTDRMDNRNIEDRDLKKRIELLEKNLEDTKDDLIDTKNTLKKIVPDLTKLIDDKIKNYMGTLNSNNSNEKYQTELVEPKKIENNNVEKSEEKKENKLDISKFIEAFSKEFNFINKDEFNEEMENNEIMGKIIELVKKMLGIKDDEKIKELKILEDKLNKEIKGLEDEIVIKKGEVKSLNIEKNNLKENINTLKEEYLKKLNEKSTEISILNDEKENLKNTYRKLESDLKNDIETKRNEIIDLKRIEEDLKDKKSKLTVENKSLENKLNNVKEEFEIVKSEIRKERESIGDLLQAKKLYDKYLSMETKILSKLDNVLIQRDFESFISSGYTLSSLDNVWDIVKIEYKNISSKDKEILKEVFAFFLAQINKRFKEAKYGLVQVEVGEDFDAVNQVDLSQNSRGIVTECVFYGYGFLKEKENPDDEDVITRRIKNPLVLTV